MGLSRHDPAGARAPKREARLPRSPLHRARAARVEGLPRLAHGKPDSGARREAQTFLSGHPERGESPQELERYDGRALAGTRVRPGEDFLRELIEACLARGTSPLRFRKSSSLLLHHVAGRLPHWESGPGPFSARRTLRGSSQMLIWIIREATRSRAHPAAGARFLWGNPECVWGKG